MAEKHPYISGSGGIVTAVNQFRKSVPPKVNADTLKKLGIAPNNESYLINILRFLGLIDDEGNRTPLATNAFSKHEDAEFQSAFEEIVKTAYKELFELHGDDTWTLDEGRLISFFRGNDQTSDLVGRRQAGTFEALASLAGHGEVPVPKAMGPRNAEVKRKPEKPVKARSGSAEIRVDAGDGEVQSHQRDVGLTVRIEVNLPPAADQDTYDRIFRSIRENLLNAK
jgi:uncharacterized protein DUF5343